MLIVLEAIIYPIIYIQKCKIKILKKIFSALINLNSKIQSQIYYMIIYLNCLTKKLEKTRRKSSNDKSKNILKSKKIKIQ